MMQTKRNPYPVSASESLRVILPNSLYIARRMARNGKRLDDRYLKWIGMPLLSILYTTAVNLPAVITEHRSWLKQYLTDFVFIVVCWMIAREIIIFSRKRFPGISKTFSRVVFLFVVTVIIAFLEAFLIVSLLNYTLYYEIRFEIKDFFYTGGLILVFSLMIVSVYELLYSLKAWNTLAVEAEALKRENLQSQLDSLKEQVKPHFLFNSLSTLIGLIDEDKERAKKFVEELAYVYRYLLQSSDKELIPLSEELLFIRAYYYLLKTRFDERLLLDIYIGETAGKQLIPPLTLQILLENAVKHNIISTERPLHVVIRENGVHQIEMTNNLQRRSPDAASTHTGLTNLTTKYKLLQHPGPELFETDDTFIVRVNLIPNPTT